MMMQERLGHCCNGPVAAAACQESRCPEGSYHSTLPDPTDYSGRPRVMGVATEYSGTFALGGLMYHVDVFDYRGGSRSSCSSNSSNSGGSNCSSCEY